MIRWSAQETREREPFSETPCPLRLGGGYSLLDGERLDGALMGLTGLTRKRSVVPGPNKWASVATGWAELR